MKFNLQSETMEIKAVDIHAMTKMTAFEYADHIKTHLIFSDSHGVIRATQGEYPLACNKTQLQILINYLQEISSGLES